MKPVTTIFAIASAFCLTPFAMHAQEHGHKHAEAAHSTESDGVQVVHAWANAADSGDSVIYMRVDNKTDHEITLIGAEGDWAENFLLVGTQLNNGNAEHVEIKPIPIKPGTAIELKPGGASILAHDLTAALNDGNIKNLHLQFGEQEIGIEVQILPHNATKHPHAGHMH